MQTAAFGFLDIDFKCPIILFLLFISDFSLFTIAVCAFPSVKFLAACPAFKLHFVVAHQLAGGLSSGRIGLVAVSLSLLNGGAELLQKFIASSSAGHPAVAQNTCSSCCCFHSDVCFFLKPQTTGEKLENCYQRNSTKPALTIDLKVKGLLR